VALLPATFRSLQRRGVAYRSLVEGDELSIGIGLVLPRDRPELRELLSAASGRL
jgi:hypothetical protein